MRRLWYGAALTAAALLLPAACARGATGPDAAVATPGWNTAPSSDTSQTASGGYFGSGLRSDSTKEN